MQLNYKKNAQLNSRKRKSEAGSRSELVEQHSKSKKDAKAGAAADSKQRGECTVLCLRRTES